MVYSNPHTKFGISSFFNRQLSRQSNGQTDMVQSTSEVYNAFYSLIAHKFAQR